MAEMCRVNQFSQCLHLLMEPILFLLKYFFDSLIRKVKQEGLLRLNLYLVKPSGIQSFT